MEVKNRSLKKQYVTKREERSQKKKRKKREKNKT